MFGLVKCRLPYTFCIVLLMVIGLGQVYIFVANRPFAGYVKMKLAEALSKPLTFPSGSAHVLLVTYARTGSSFVGDLLQSYPDTFYFFEPLHFVSDSVIDSSYPEAKFLINRLFHCESSKVPGFMDWQQHYMGYMKLQRNERYWMACSGEKPNSCFDASYLDRYCSSHGVVAMKSIRLTLREASSLYSEFPELNLKIMYLIRDPRATMLSRNKTSIQYWCKQDPKCYSPSDFCSMLSDDLEMVCKLLRQRPGDFFLVRYEDIAKDPYHNAHSIMEFLGLNWTASTEAFLETHTGTAIANAGDGLEFEYNTYRNSLEASSAWRQSMDFSQVQYIQEPCKDVLDAFGYHIYGSSSIMKSDIDLNIDLKSSITNYCNYNK